MEIVSHWKGIKTTCSHCAAQFTMSAEDIAEGKLLTESDSMLRVLQSGVNTVLFTFCPACEHRVLIAPNVIPQFYKNQTKVMRP
jgi:hypothetical protein